MKNVLKKLMVVLNVFALCFSSFSAIVADNDGSAFITKAEFDSLKETFDSQIVNYNESIDSKIDGAIAAYLAGINTSHTENKDLIFKDWKYVTNMNYKPQEQYKFPGVNLSFQLSGNTTVSSVSSFQVWWAWAKTVANKAGGDNRYVCDANTESSTKPSNVTWKGLSIGYEDQVNISLDGLCNSDNMKTTGFLSQTSYGNFYLEKKVYLVPGYYSNINTSADTIWPTSMYYYQSVDSQYGRRTVDSWKGKSGAFSVSLAKDNNDKEYTYEHILHYTNQTGIYLSDPNWVHTLGINPNNYKYSKDMTVTNTGNWAGIQRNWISGQPAVLQSMMGKDFSDYYINTYTTNADNSQKVPNVGLLEKAYTSSTIKQWKDSLTVEYNKQKYTLNPMYLNEGFCICRVAEDENFKWTPKFKNLKVDGVATNFDINFVVANKPFTSGSTTSGKIIRCKNSANDYITTKNNECTFTADIKDDSFLYCTWYPSNTTTRNKKWEATLDLENCGTYQIFVEK